jgi:long-chain acyl-CoA synthetase
MSTLAALLVDKLERHGERVALHAADGADWRARTWAHAARETAAIARWLAARGVGRGDRVAILGGPDPRWLASDFATLCLGAATVGIYPTLTTDAIRWQLRHAQVKALLVAPDVDLGGLLADPEALPDRMVAASWDELTATSATEADLTWLRARATEVRPDDLCAIFYTSGTTGDPKGVMVTHAAMVATAEATRAAIPLRPGERSLVFLPLAHSLQRIAVYRALLEDIEAFVCPSLDRFAEVLQLARPSVLVTVPRMLEKIRLGAEATAAKRGPRAERVFRWAVAVGAERSRLAESGRDLPLWLRARLLVADRLVFRTIRARLGGALETIVVGGARLDPDVGRFFHGAGIAVCEGWGLTETCAPATVNAPGDARFGSVGSPLPGMELRIDPTDGEVLVRGPGLFRGYWRDEEATRAAFDDDGFFRTGDVGELEDGCLRITDRKKEILVTSGGKNIPPVNIEKRLEGGVFGQAVVIGNDRPYLVALLAPDPEVGARADARVRDANASLSSFEQVKRWAVLPGPLTVEDGMLTPTLKLRRAPIAARWHPLIEDLYASRG